jgi:hypothetical protein
MFQPQLREACGSSLARAGAQQLPRNIFTIRLSEALYT